jgi:hypothetical protein
MRQEAVFAEIREENRKELVRPSGGGGGVIGNGEEEREAQADAGMMKGLKSEQDEGRGSIRRVAGETSSSRVQEGKSRRRGDETGPSRPSSCFASSSDSLRYHPRLNAFTRMDSANGLGLSALSSFR